MVFSHANKNVHWLEEKELQQLEQVSIGVKPKG